MGRQTISLEEKKNHKRKWNKIYYDKKKDSLKKQQKIKTIKKIIDKHLRLKLMISKQYIF